MFRAFCGLLRGSSGSADPLMADRPRYSLTFTSQPASKQAVPAPQSDGATPMILSCNVPIPDFSFLIPLAFLDILCMCYRWRLSDIFSLQQAMTYKTGWVDERAKGHDNVQRRLILILNDGSIQRAGSPSRLRLAQHNGSEQSQLTVIIIIIVTVDYNSNLKKKNNSKWLWNCYCCIEM